MVLEARVLPFFPTPLLAVRLTDVNNQSIANVVYALRNAGFMYGGPGLGGLQTQGNLLKTENLAIRQLANAFQGMIEQAAQPNHHILQMMIWAVLGRPGDLSLDSPHNHLPYHFSAVYWPQVPRDLQPPEGNLIFFDPREVYTGGKPAHIPPQEGLMVLFPSWMKHTVVPLRAAATDRISISLNAIIGPPPGSPDYFPPHRVKRRPPGVVLPQEFDPTAPEHFPYPVD